MTEYNLNSTSNYPAVYDELKFLELAPLGHPHRPLRSSMLFLKKGRILVKEQINDIEIVENSIFLIDTKYVYQTLEISEDLEIYLLAYDYAYIERVSIKLNKLKVYANLRKQLVRKFEVTESEINIFLENLKLMNYYLNNTKLIEFADKIIENIFNVILYHLISIASPIHNNNQSKMTSQQKISYNFILLVSENYLKTKSVKFYADCLQISTRHLSTVVKSITGKTPNDIISEFIINEAKAQLSSSSYSIGEIANSLKFSDQYAFTHFFKRHTNSSPTYYRKQFEQ